MADPAAVSDIDWDAVAIPRVGSSHGELVPVAGGGDAEGDDSDVRLLDRARAKWAIKIPHPTARSKDQQALAAARMREHRSKRLRIKQQIATKTTMNKLFTELRSVGVMLDVKTRALMKKDGRLTIQGFIGRRLRKMPMAAVISIAYSSIAKRNDVARSFKVAPKTVARIRVAVAFAAAKSDTAFLNATSEAVRTRSTRVFVSGAYCDATKEQLKIPMHDGLLPDVCRSSWNVLVSSQRFAWCFEGATQWFQSDFVRPNVPIVSDAGECLLDGMYRVPSVSAFADLEVAGMQAAGIGIAHWDLDGHPANIRMVAGRRAELKPGTLVSVRHCGNHANNLVEGCVLDCIGYGISLFLCMTAMFLSMGGNFLRLIHATPQLISNFMLPPVRKPPAESEFDRLIAEELKDYSVRNYKAFVDAATVDDAWSSDESADEFDKEENNKRRKKHWAFIGAWDRFLAFWKGRNIWRVSESIGPHYCHSPGCCNGYDLNVTKLRACKTVVDLLWRSQPVRPTKGKWTKLGPSIDWHIQSGIMNMFAKTFVLAFDKMSLKVIKQGEQNEDTAYLIDVDWHAVRGSRCSKVLAGLSDNGTFARIVILGVVLEPIRWLTRWFLRRASITRRLKRQQKKMAAPIMDMVWYQASPAVRVLQYFSQLLSGNARRLRLIWSREYNSFEEWADSEEELLDVFRRAIGMASSWVFYRFFQLYMAYPWLLTALVDPRRVMADKRTVATAFFDAVLELLDMWFSKLVQERITSADDLFEESWQMALWLWAWQILCTIAQAEFQHGRNRHRAHEQDLWSNFVAKCGGPPSP